MMTQIVIRYSMDAKEKNITGLLTVSFTTKYGREKVSAVQAVIYESALLRSMFVLSTA